MSTSSAAFADGEKKSNLKNIFERPLILGASVSGDYLTESPGKRLALRYTKSDQIKVIARKGTPGKELLKSVSASAVKDRTVIVAMDLFFWDSLAASPAESLKAMDRIVKLAREQNIPIVIGDVPALMPSRQTSVLAINKQLKETCKDYPQCKILPLDAILRKTLSDGFIVQDGKKHGLEALLPDGLHISKTASEYLADQIFALF
ncbi:MAG: SGNH/GDSL hydrolase family protein [Proteobacteria bacterium]|nr:MAG: SGNH/GDSL hydrolase family protein [Pseudomonadota bacterium]